MKNIFKRLLQYETERLWVITHLQIPGYKTHRCLFPEPSTSRPLLTQKLLYIDALRKGDSYGTKVLHNLETAIGLRFIGHRP